VTSILEYRPTVQGSDFTKMSVSVSVWRRMAVGWNRNGQIKIEGNLSAGVDE